MNKTCGKGSKQLSLDVADWILRLGQHEEKMQQVWKELDKMSRTNQQPGLITDPKFKMPIGRYKDCTLEEIAGFDYPYLEWITENTKYEIHTNLLDDFREKLDTARGIIHSPLSFK